MPSLSDHPLPLFGPRLRQLRRAMGVKQSALAEDLGIDQATVSRWEAGRQAPDPQMRERAIASLSRSSQVDAALRRLVEHSAAAVHLVEETSHRCLAYSPARARDWGVSTRAFLGVSLWPYATQEIQQAETQLGASDWWHVAMPQAKQLYTSGAEYDDIRITAGDMLWERLYLSDGTPVRLTTGLR